MECEAPEAQVNEKAWLLREQKHGATTVKSYKIHRNMALKASKKPARHVPEPSKIEAWSAPGSQNVPKIHPRPTKRRPRAPKKRPRCAQGAPKKGQELAKSAQKMAKWRPIGAQHGPRSLQDRVGRAPRRICSAILVRSAVRKALGAMSCHFLMCAESSRYVKNLEKPRKNNGFYALEAFAKNKRASAQQR